MLGAVCLLLFLSVSVEAAQLGRITSEVNFRKAPDTSASVIGRLPEGAEVRVIRAASADWYEISHAGRLGFVHKNYVRLDPRQNSRRVETKNRPAWILGMVLAASGIILMASVLAPDLLLHATILGLGFGLVVVFDLLFQLGLLYSLFFVSFAVLALVIFFKRKKKVRSVSFEEISPRKAA